MTIVLTMREDASEAAELLERVANLGIVIDAVSLRLQEEGIRKFDASFGLLLQAIAGKASPQAGSPESAVRRSTEVKPGFDPG